MKPTRRQRASWHAIATRWPSPDEFIESTRADESLRRYLSALGNTNARSVRVYADTARDIVSKQSDERWFFLVDLTP